MKINGIVLAAGYGSRLAPLTDRMPKPVLPFCGEPLLLRILGRLREAGVNRIAVNTHHLGGQVAECIRNSKFAECVEIFPEKEILGTAGPLLPAKKMLTDCDCFILHNGDVACDFDLKRMLREHLESGASLTMALLDGPENRVHVENGRVVDILKMMQVPYSPAGRELTYGCISIISPDFYDCLPDTVQPYAFKDAWLAAFRMGKKIHAYIPDSGCFWNDIGSFEQYFEAQRAFLAKCGTPLVQGKENEIAADAVFTGFNTLGNGCRIPAGAHLHNCVVLDGAEVPSGYSAWTVFGKGFSCQKDERIIRKLSFMREDSAFTVSALPEQGSSRKFYRIQYPDGRNRILLLSDETDEYFDLFTNLGAVFHKYGMRTPEIFAVDKAAFAVLMEDLGRDMLYDVCRRSTPEKMRRFYRETLHALAEYQMRGESAIGKETLSIRSFAIPYLRWETDYCRKHFFGKICGFDLTAEENRKLTAEFDSLAVYVRKQPYLLQHRDFHSQNVMVKGSSIRFVDFQGTRIGPYLYDVVSLLKDPYMDLPYELRDDLAEYYRQDLEKRGWHISPERFAVDYAAASLQRNMQALGAYGFLSFVKNKRKYLAYAEPCLRLLRESVDFLQQSHIPELHLETLSALCSRAAAVLPERIRQLTEVKKEEKKKRKDHRKMKKITIAVMLAEGFEDVEALAPTDIWRRLGFNVILAGVTGSTVRTSHGVTVSADLPAEKLNPAELDAVYLPGGLPGAVNLKNSALVIRLVQEMHNSGRIVGAICAAPIVLAHAGLTDRCKVTGYPGTEKDHPGLTYTGNLVEWDQKVLTGRGPGAAIPLAFRMARELGIPEENLNTLKEGMFL